MNFELEKQWREVSSEISKNFGEEIDLQTILFLIGIQELNIEFDRFNKDQKIDIIHIGLCTVFEPYGYYVKEGVDKDGWPHFKNEKKLPNLNDKEQERIIKEAIIDYFKK